MSSVFITRRKRRSSTKTEKKSRNELYFPAEERETPFQRLQWCDPPDGSPPVTFCLDTSLHGLRYLGLRDLHLCERIFWFVAFVAAVTTAAFLILQMWNANRNMPITTVFHQKETKISEIPFPSVTICNVNNIRKSKREGMFKKAHEGLAGNLTEEELLRTFASLLDIYHVCTSSRSFIDRFAEPPRSKDMMEVVHVMRERRDEYLKYLNPVETIRNTTQRCKEMILLCMWLNKVQDCSELFQGIETDYGYCCTFNAIPASLLMKHSVDDRFPELAEDWDEANLTNDNLIFTQETKGRKYPFRQQYPGRSTGLSFLLDPDLDEYACMSTDSEGFVLGLNNPLDFPRMKDNGIAIRTNSEVFITIRPEITLADDSTKQFSLDKRQCYFSNEFPLLHYTKYTTSNCINECITNKTLEECDCIRYFMPSGASGRKTLCIPEQYNCTNAVRENITRDGLNTICHQCIHTCNKIVYYSESTTLPMRQENEEALFKKFPRLSKARNVSIVHVYFNVDGVYPRLRKQTTTVIKLISNTGGLLGLFMGFSMLSLLEIIYHGTIRLFWAFHRKRKKDRRNDNRDEDSVMISSLTPTESGMNYWSKVLGQPGLSQ